MPDASGSELIRVPLSGSNLPNGCSKIYRRGLSLQEQLKAFGERASLLQNERVSQEHYLSEDFTKSLWKLLLEMRPFLFLNAPEEVCVIPPDVRIYRTGNVYRDLRHVRLVVRFYLAVLRLAVSHPLACLHGSLTLLSLLPTLADPHPALRSSTQCYLEGLKFICVALYNQDPNTFYRLVEALLSPCDYEGNGGIGSFAPSPTAMLWNKGYMRCSLEVLPLSSSLQELYQLIKLELEPELLPSISGYNSRKQRDLAHEPDVTETCTFEQLRGLFYCQIQATSEYEVCSSAFGFCFLMNQLISNNGSISLNLLQASSLVALSCGILSTQIESKAEGAKHGAHPLSPSQELYQRAAKLPRGESTAIFDDTTRCKGRRHATPKLECVSLTRFVHEEAWRTLVNLVETQSLRHPIHAPVVLHTVIEWWHFHAANLAGDNFLAASTISSFWFRMLLWVTLQAPYAPWLRTLFSPHSLHEYILMEVLSLLEHSLVRPPKGSTPRLNIEGSSSAYGTETQLSQVNVFVASCYIFLLDSALHLIDIQARQQVCLLYAESLPLSDHIERLLSLPLPYFAWRDAKVFSPKTIDAVFATHRLASFFPPMLVEALLQEVMGLAQERLPVPAYRVVAANMLGWKQQLQIASCKADNQHRDWVDFNMALQETLHDLIQDSDPDVAVFIEAFTILLYYETQKPQRSITELESPSILRILKAINENFALHNASVLQVSGDSWFLFFTLLLEILPIPTTKMYGSVYNALYRSFLVPRKGEAEQDIFNLRLAGMMAGLNARLGKFLRSITPYFSADAVNRQFACCGSENFFLSKLPSKEEAKHIHSHLQSLVLLLQECTLASESFTTVLSLYKDKPACLWSKRRRDSAAVLFYSFSQLQLTILAAERVLRQGAYLLECVGDCFSTVDFVLSEVPNVIVNVDEDDEGEAAKTEIDAPENEHRRIRVEAQGSASSEPHSLPVFDRLIELSKKTISLITDVLNNNTANMEKDYAGFDSCCSNNFNSLSYPYPSFHEVVDLNLLKCLFVSVALSPIGLDADLCIPHAIRSHPDPVLRCGYGALAFDAIICSPGGVLSLIEAKEDQDNREGVRGPNWLEWEAQGSSDGLREASSAMIRKLEFLQAIFTHSYTVFLCDDLADSRMVEFILRAPSRSPGSEACVLSQAMKVFRVCLCLWENITIPLAVRTVVVETASKLLHAIHWSTEDLCRQMPDMVGKSFFSVLCDMTETKKSVVMMNCLDVLLKCCLEEASRDPKAGAARLAQLSALNNDKSIPNNGFCPMMACVLYNAASPKEKLSAMKCLVELVGTQVEFIPELMKRSLASVLLNIISYEASAQLSHRLTRSETDYTSPTDQPRDDVDNCLSSTTYTHFCLAIQQAVALCDCASTEENTLLSVLEKPASVAVAGHVLVHNLFDIIDSISGLMGVKHCPMLAFPVREAGERARMRPYNSPSSLMQNSDQMAPVASETTLNRWLLGLCSFIRFMGPHATIVAAKLPSMLEYCYQIPTLLEVVCMVWSSLIDSCTQDYLEEHAPAIAVELVSLDFTHTMNALAFGKLRQAVKRLYLKTEKQPFWQSYVKLMSMTSRLIKALCQEVDLYHASGSLEADRQTSETDNQAFEPDASAKTPLVSRPPPPRADFPKNRLAVDKKSRMGSLEEVNIVIGGFLSIMRGSSRKCKAMSSHALHEYLQRADVETRLVMGKVVRENIDVIPTLLRWICELDCREVEFVLSCIGVIGAMSPSTFLSVDTHHKTSENSGVDLHFIDKKSDSATTTSGFMHLFVSQRYYLDVDMVLNWRSLCMLLLEVYCPRALANTSDPVMHDRVAYAVQELLRVCTKKERHEVNGIPLGENEILRIEELNRYLWWTQLPSSVRKMLEGFITTRYATLIVHQTKHKTPEYRTGMPFLTWMFALFRNLAARCTGWFAEVVASLRNVAKRDASIMMFLLPHLVVYILKHGNVVAHEDLLTEIDVIFATASATGMLEKSEIKHQQQGHHFSSLRTQSPREPASARSFSSDAPLTTTDVDEHVQYVLHLLEDINQLRWALLRVGHKISRCRTIETDNFVEESCICLAAVYREFIDRVCWPKRALAGIAVGSYLRALRSVESQRRLPKVSEVISAIPLQRVFASMGDRDSARSIHRLTQNLPVAEAAFSLENNGDWLLALQNCELVLQHDPESIPHQFTLLRCMRHLGQLHLMSRYAEASLVQHARTPQGRDAGRCMGGDHIATMRNYANEAAWRLGEWDKVHSDPTLPVSLAGPVVQLLHAFQGTKHPTLVKIATAEQRRKLVSVIQATCREGYTQSYPHMVILHALADVDLVVDAILLSQRPSCVTNVHRNSTAEFPAPSDSRRSHVHHITVSSKAGRNRASARSATSVLASDRGNRAVASVVDAFKARMNHLDHSLEAREPILSLHRCIYRALGLSQEVSETWIEHARLLRDAGFFEAALNAARQSDYEAAYPSSSAFYLLSAEILHDMNATIHAMEFAQDCVQNRSLPSTVRAQLQLLLTNWKLENGSQAPKEVISSYEEVLALDSELEEAHHCLALFYDKLYTVSCEQHFSHCTKKTLSSSASSSCVEKEALEKTHATILQSVENYAQFAVAHFGKALLQGHTTMAVSLPRMLTLWLDTSSDLFDMASVVSQPATIAKADHLLKHLTSLIESYLLPDQGKRGCISPKVVITALPQLLSRLCHPSAHVVSIVTRAVVNLMRFFPQQCLWMVLPIVFSHQEARAKITRLSILNPFIQQNVEHKVHLENAYTILKSFIDICNCQPSTFGNNAKLTRQPFIQNVEKILPSAKFIVPTMNNLTPNISAEDTKDVFPTSPWLHHFDEKVRVMSSLQKPKRIWVHTNEGSTISFLCKSKDEPRKDIRMMEIASLMNTFFLKDSDARRRCFSLRRYSIAALTDDCALIEWVNHTSPLRNIVNQTYVLDGSGVRISDVKKWYAKVEAKKLSKLDLFSQHILPAAPPVLHQWFDMSFSNNQEWYQARNLFTQSTALWSIAGHIVGLGDRHGENLMIDLHCGEMMHVDFACMFDKGETLEVPECVRFRLTQNLIDGMGVLGVEGPFRRNCEIALRCQIKNKKAVMSIVETLLHDPLVEWSHRSTRRPAVAPKRLVARVARRLDGFLDLFSASREEDTLAMNVEGQVSKLIRHSAALENLSEMYIWWMAWI